MDEQDGDPGQAFEIFGQLVKHLSDFTEVVVAGQVRYHMGMIEDFAQGGPFVVGGVRVERRWAWSAGRTAWA